MALFEIESGKLIPAQIGVEVPGGISADTLEAVRAQVLEVIEQPLFPVAWETAADLETTLTGVHSLTALDASGQIVSVEVISEMNSASIIAAMARLGQISNYSWYDLATLYPGGAEAFQKSWKEFREAMPATHRPGARLYLVAGSIENNVYAALGMLQSTGLEVHKLSIRKMSNGRTFLESTLIKNRQIQQHLPLGSRSRASLRIARQVSAQAPESLGVKTLDPVSRSQPGGAAFGATATGKAADLNNGASRNGAFSARSAAPAAAQPQNSSVDSGAEALQANLAQPAKPRPESSATSEEYQDYTGTPLRIVPSGQRPGAAERTRETGAAPQSANAPASWAGSPVKQNSNQPVKQITNPGTEATAKPVEVAPKPQELGEIPGSKATQERVEPAEKPVAQALSPRSYPARVRVNRESDQRDLPAAAPSSNPALTSADLRGGVGIARGYQERSRRLRASSSIPALDKQPESVSASAASKRREPGVRELKLLAAELGSNTVLLWRDRFGHVVELLLRLDGKLESGNGHCFDDLQTAFNYVSGGRTEVNAWEELRISNLQGASLLQALQELKLL